MKGFLLITLIGSTALASPVQGPVAVMPFKNLNANPSLEWLRAGISETMISDLKKTGEVTVVERSQIDKALAEIALQTQAGTEESTAAKLGKMTGARTVVLGSFQEASQQLRINARFVSVESGEVTGAAKTTGPIADVFLLQDEILARLLGADPHARAAHPRARRTGAKTVKAYQLYAMALTTASDADRVSYLKQSVAADPQFSYAVEDLDALQKRLEGYQKKADAISSEQAEALEKAIGDPSIPENDRCLKATQWLGSLLSRYQYRRVLEASQRIIDLHLPKCASMDPVEYARYMIFLAHQQLKETEQAFRTGEQYLRQYPAGLYAQAVQLQMKSMIREREGEDDERARTEHTLAEIAHDREEFSRRPPRDPQMVQFRQELFDYRTCMAYTHDPAKLIDVCSDFVKKWTGGDPRGDEEIFIAQWWIAMAYSKLGKFDEARTRADQLKQSNPKKAREMSIDMVEATWPRD